MMDNPVRSLNQRGLKPATPFFSFEVVCARKKSAKSNLATSRENGVADLQFVPGEKAPSQTWLLQEG